MNSDTKNADLDWRLIRAFVAVAEAGTLSAAARRLGTTQPTIGRQIRELEALCGEVLFHRRGTRLEPVPAARTILEQARDVDAAVRSLSQAFTRIADAPDGQIVRITAPTLICDRLLPHLLPAILDTLPEVEIQIDPSDIVQDLQRRHADIAIRLTDPVQPDLIAQKLGSIGLGLFASKAYLDVYGIPRGLEAFAAHRLILPVDEEIVRVTTARLGISPDMLRSSLRSDDLRHRHALMAAGLGIGTGHHWLGRTDRHMVRLLPDIELTRFPVWLVTTEDVRLSRSRRAVFDALCAALKPWLI
ncbi:MAG: LysR family transcriptional regulator [Caulobacterales bacterium]|uniref:LysR family transcriptional regulator n=1 Tax=Glycocaulis sp. TaxID=1969725 RepID=UPI003FA0B118